MKKLQERSIQSKNSTKLTIQPQDIHDNTILVLPETVSRDNAVEKKLESLRVKMFGLNLGKFEIGEMRDVYVPYSIMTYSFLIERKSVFNKKGFLNKAGELNFIFDYNEAHPFQFDIEENGELGLKKVKLTNNNRIILPQHCTSEEAREKMEWHIQARVLRRIYSAEGKIALLTEKKFYRAAVEMRIKYGVNENLRYAYLDGFGINSEHILGLKYRIG